MKKKLTIVNGLLVAAVSLMLFAGCGDDHNTSSVASGKVVQSPVEGAVVFIDINGNRQLDDSEPSTTSDDEGNYTLQIPDGIDGMLCTTGGTLTDSGRPALPSLAPRDAKNITPLTTLVAINPGAKSVIGDDWDVDISRSAGISGKLMQLALAVESFQSSLKSLNSNAASQFSALSFLASNLTGKSLNNDDEVNKAFEETIADLNEEAGKELPPTILNNIKEITAGIVDNDSNIDESEAKTLVGSFIPSSPAIAFLPSTDLEEMVMPMPNDIVWTGLEGKLPTAGETDASKLALYTAINKLGNSGLSPNTPISIPLSDDTALDADSLEASVIMLEAKNTMLKDGFVSLNTDDDLKIIQDGNFIKIYPEDTLNSGKQYAVVIKNDILLKGSTEEKVSKNPLFELLKSSVPLYTDESTASDTTKKLEQIRQKYAPLFANFSGTDVLTLFTFTTAAKTLSANDFDEMKSTISDEGNPDDMTINGLPYAGVKAGLEYEEIVTNEAPLTSTVGNMVVEENSFSSVDISKQEAALVPYTIFDGTSYDDTVVVFQHGFGGSMANAKNFKGTSHPVIAMDLPYHGDRTPEGKTSGSEYLTTNLPQNRMNLYQSFYDMSVLIQGLKEGKFDIDGDGDVETPTNIHFVGQSLGAITGSVVAKNNAASLDKVVLNVGGANFASILDTATNATLTGLLDKLGVEKNSVEYFVTLGVLQLIMDPCDPIYLAVGSSANPIFQFAYKDTLVSNVSNQILGSVAGANNLYFADFSNSYETPDGEPYSASFNAGDAYVFGGTEDKTDNWIPHGFLLDPIVSVDGKLKYPEAKGFMDEDYATEAYTVVNDWTAEFLNK